MPLDAIEQAKLDELDDTDMFRAKQGITRFTIAMILRKFFEARDALVELRLTAINHETRIDRIEKRIAALGREDAGTVYISITPKAEDELG